MLSMQKRGLLVSVALFVVLLTGMPAQASVVGKWATKGPCVIDVSMGGISDQMKDTVRDRFTFSPDGTFSMIGMHGKWRMKNRGFVVHLDISDLEESMERLLREQGLDAEVDVESVTFGGQEVGPRIKGTMTLRLSFYITGYPPGSLSMVWNYTGKRIATGGAELEGDANPFLRSLFPAIQESVRNMVIGASSPVDAALPQGKTNHAGE